MRIGDMVTRNLPSPYGLTVASTLLFAVAYLFPPSLYTRYISEPDYIFLDPASLLFFFICTMGFVFGLLIIDYGFRLPEFVPLARKVRMSPVWFILLPVLLGSLFDLFASFRLLRDNQQLLQVLLAMQASDLKTEGSLEISGPISQATPLLMGIVWWALYRKGELPLSRGERRAISLSLAFASLNLLLSSTLMVARGELMPIIAGIALVVLLAKLRSRELTSAFAFKMTLGFLGCVALMFVAFSILRGHGGSSAATADILGYTISAYNRLAAMLAGRFRYPFSGEGLYISGFASFNRSFNSVFHLNGLLEWPDFDTVWRSEFDAVSAAGLDGRLIWSGTFGYIYSDLKWFSPLLLFLYGLATGWAWRDLKLGKVTGVVLYPWCAFCILFWFGSNYLLDPKVADLLVLVALLAVYESWFTVGRAEGIVQ